jgi:hypothetical protein
MDIFPRNITTGMILRNSLTELSHFYRDVYFYLLKVTMIEDNPGLYQIF